MEIKELIRNARTENGFTQEKAAEELCVSRQTISNWENGKSLPDILSILKMSDLYHISLDELLKGDKKMVEKIKKDASYEKKQKFYMHLMTIVMAGMLLVEFCTMIGKIKTDNLSLEFYHNDLYVLPFVIAAICCITNVLLYKLAEKRKSPSIARIPSVITEVLLLYLIFDIVMSFVSVFKEKGVIAGVVTCILMIIISVITIKINDLYDKKQLEDNG